MPVVRWTGPQRALVENEAAFQDRDADTPLRRANAKPDRLVLRTDVAGCCVSRAEGGVRDRWPSVDGSGAMEVPVRVALVARSAGSRSGRSRRAALLAAPKAAAQLYLRVSGMGPPPKLLNAMHPEPSRMPWRLRLWRPSRSRRGRSRRAALLAAPKAAALRYWRVTRMGAQELAVRRGIRSDRASVAAAVLADIVRIEIRTIEESCLVGCAQGSCVALLASRQAGRARACCTSRHSGPSRECRRGHTGCDRWDRAPVTVRGCRFLGPRPRQLSCFFGTSRRNERARVAVCLRIWSHRECRRGYADGSPPDETCSVGLGCHTR
jgi:hypothetical protein